MQASAIGEIAELAFQYKAKKAGFNILQPHGNSLSYDVVLEKNGKFFKIQIKSSTYNEGKKFQFTVNKGRKKSGYVRGEFDFLSLYIHALDIFFLIPFRDDLKTTMYVDPYDEASELYQFKEAWDLIV